MMDDTSTLPVTADVPRRVSTVAALTDIPEEEIWLSKQKSARTRRAYRLDVARRGDTLVIWRLDRLGRTTHQLVGLLERFERDGTVALSDQARRRARLPSSA